MTVQDLARTVHVPRQARPLDPPLVTAPAPAAVARRRPMDRDERQFVWGLLAVMLTADTVIVTGTVVAQHVWG